MQLEQTQPTNTSIVLHVDSEYHVKMIPYIHNKTMNFLINQGFNES